MKKIEKGSSQIASVFRFNGWSKPTNTVVIFCFLMLRSCVAPSTSCQTKRQLPWDQDARKNIVWNCLRKQPQVQRNFLHSWTGVEIGWVWKHHHYYASSPLMLQSKALFATCPLSTHSKHSSGHAKALPRQLRQESQRTKICQDMPRYPSAWTGWLRIVLLGALTCHQQNSWGLSPNQA